LQKWAGLAVNQCSVIASLSAARRRSHISQGNTVIGCNDTGSWIFGNMHDR